MLQSAISSIATDPEKALAHFEAALAFGIDCPEVYDAIDKGEAEFVLIDVRAASAYAQGHIDGAINIPCRELTAENLLPYSKHIEFVVYGRGLYSNEAVRAAIQIARNGRLVRVMTTGIAGWLEAGFELTR